MKKLLCAGILVMVFCLIAGQVGAADLQVRLVSVDGYECHPGDHISPWAEQFVIEISLVNWNFGTDVILAVNTKLSLSPANMVTLDWGSMALNPIFDWAFSGLVEVVANQQYIITTANLDCAGNADPTWLAQLTLNIFSGAMGTLTIRAETDAGADYCVTHATDGCINPIFEDRTGGDGILTIPFYAAMPTRQIIPPRVTVNPTESVQFDVGGTHFCGWEPPQIVFSDTCAHGDVDNETGLFTTVATRYESCIVSIFDNAYPDVCDEMGSDCTAAVTIMSDCAADCNGDGRVNTTDLGIMKVQFFKTDCPVP